MGKAQFAMEYLLVVGFSLVIIVPVIGLLYQEYDQNRTDVRVEHLTELSREIVFQAEKVYYQGAPSRVVIETYIPPGTTRFEIKPCSVEFDLASTSSSIYADTALCKKDISGNIIPVFDTKTYNDPVSGKRFIVIQADDPGTPTDVSDDFVRIYDRDLP